VTVTTCSCPLLLPLIVIVPPSGALDSYSANCGQHLHLQPCRCSAPLRQLVELQIACLVYSPHLTVDSVSCLVLLAVDLFCPDSCLALFDSPPLSLTSRSCSCLLLLPRAFCPEPALCPSGLRRLSPAASAQRVACADFRGHALPCSSCPFACDLSLPGLCLTSHSSQFSLS
jgi:hypothetical protein